MQKMVEQTNDKIQIGVQISVYLDIDQGFVKGEELCLNSYLVGWL